MAGVVEAIPAALPLPSVTPTFVDGGAKNVCWLSRDRSTLYATTSASASSTLLSRSTDDGATWTTVHTFSQATRGMIETADGEALVSTFTTDGALWKSSGWSTNPLTATWTSVLSSSGTGCFVRPQWGLHQWSQFGPLIVVNEYGNQTVSPFTAPAATKVWLSTNYGATWAVIYDLLVQQPSTQNLHMHGSCYDPWWDRIWIAWGDGGTGTTPNPRSGIAYSDDHGATWTNVTGTFNNSSTEQTVSIIPMARCLLFGTDGPPYAMRRIARTGYRTMGTFEDAFHLVRGGTSGVALSYQTWRNQGQGPKAPLIMCVGNGSSAQAVVSNSMLIVTYDGYTFQELYRDTVNTAANKGFFCAVGPTASGKIVAACSDSRQTNASRVTFTMPDASNPASP